MAESRENEYPKQLSNSDEPLKLSDLLARGWKIFEEVDNTNEQLSGSIIQNKVKVGISMLEQATRIVSQFNLFSKNEELEEIATADLKYLLLPALLGALTMKQTNRDKRLEFIQTARVYFMDFLKRCKDYNVSQFELPKSLDENTSPDEENGLSTATAVHCSSDLVCMAAQRQAKIEQYRQKTALESRLLDLRSTVDSGQADDEITRDFYILSAKKWVTVCLEEIKSISQEVEILKMMDGEKRGVVKQPAHPVRPPIKPFILTKDAVQAQVFGSGYPSLPTMTVDDWYEQHRQHGVLPDQGIPRKVAVEDDDDVEEREEEENEKKAEMDEEMSLVKARTWDDWKDTHRRGYGNRQNMG